MSRSALNAMTLNPMTSDAPAIAANRRTNSVDRTARLRRGYSLLELLLVVSIFSMVMVAVAFSLQVMYRMDRQLKEDFTYAQVVPRLSVQLRSDVHAARDVALLEVADEPPGVSLAMAAAGEVIEYRSEAGRVVRIWRRDDVELGREVFSLGKTSTSQWQKIETPSAMLELEIVRPRGKIKSEDARQVDRLVAAIGIRAANLMEAGAS